MNKKYYAIKKIEEKEVNMLLENWSECEKFIKGKKSEYKSFKSKEEAIQYLNKKRFNNEYTGMKKGITYMFVDGSYDKQSNYYSYAVIILKDDIILDLLTGKGININGDNNISGENEATLQALEYAQNNNIKEFTICYDCESNFRHSYWGDWKRNKKSSKKYYENTCKYKNLNPQFYHIKGHQNSSEAYLNEMADTLCKQELGINFSCILDNLITHIQVKNNHIKDKLKDIISEDKVKVV